MKSWRNARFDEIFDRVDRKFLLDDSEQYKCVGVRWYGMGAFVRERLLGAQISRKQQWIIRSGDVVYNKLFAWKGAFAIADQSVDGCIVSDKFPTYRANDGKVDERWLWYYFQTPKLAQQAEALSKGAAAISKLTLNPPQFWDLTIPLPPLPGQQRILTRIDALAPQIHEARSLRQQATHEADALFASVLLALLPRNIATTRLGDLIAPNSKISYGVLVPGPDMEDGIPFVRVQDLDVRNPTELPNKRISPEVEAQYVRTRLRGGEILIGVVGSIGKVGIAPPSWAGANIARAVCRITPSEAIDRDYLALVLLARPTQEYFRETTRTLAQPTLNVAQLAETPIPVASLSEQRRIVAELRAVQAKMNALRKLQAETAAELDALLPSVLDKAFKGEL